MNTKIIIALMAIATLISCNTKNKTAGEGEEHEEHSPEGIVILNKNQREALKLKLGSFQMRNLTTVVKSNGQLEVPPANSADITARYWRECKRDKGVSWRLGKQGAIIGST